MIANNKSQQGERADFSANFAAGILLSHCGVRQPRGETPMHDIDDMSCLREYVRTGSQQAFAAIVERRVNLVYSAALRQVNESHLAEDVTQSVFVALARKAGLLARTEVVISAWLLHATRLASLDARKRLARRRIHEQKAAAMKSEQTSEPDSQTWSNIRPLLDTALARLAEKDRRAIVLRYFEDLSLREVGEVMGVSEEAARQRVWRATEKLREIFAGRGVVCPSAALASIISAHAIHAAPPALAASATKAAVAAGASGAAAPWLTKGVIYLMAWTKTQIGIAATAAVLLVGTGASVIYVAKSPKPQTIVIDPKAKPPAPVARPLGAQNAGPDLTPDEKKRFNEVYALAEGQSLKRVQPPFIPERNIYMKHLGGWMDMGDNDVTQFAWRGEAQWTQWTRSGATVGGVIRIVMNIPNYKIELSPQDAKRPLKGDWILRPQATIEQKLADLTKIFHEQLNWPVHFEKRSAQRPVFVARGPFHYTPAEGASPMPGAHYMLHWYVGDKVPKQQNGLSAGKVPELLVSLGESIGREIVDEAGSNEQLFWANHITGDVTGPNAELLLKNITAQTGITFTPENRTVDYWAIVPDKSEGVAAAN